MPRIIRAGNLVPTPWRNGRGTSFEIASEIGPDGIPLWQVSIAELVQDGPFSHYPNCDRVFTPIAGDPPPELSFQGGPLEPCPLLIPRPFPGDIPTESRIPSPGRAFNAIVDRRRHRVSVRVERLADGIAIDGGTVVHCLSGRLELAGEVLDADDSAVEAGLCRAVGPAVLAVVRVF